MFQETLVLTLVYILIVAIAFSPKTCKVEPVEKIEYFPEIEAVEPAPISLPQAIASNPSVTDLASMTIRQLKTLASQVKLPRYSSLTKSQLIVKLSQWEPV